jgi:hypothetical protein
MASRPVRVTFTPQEINQLQQFRASVAEFREMVAAAPANERNPEYNQQFNQLRQEAHHLLKGRFVTAVPKAITGDVTTDRSISVIVIAGVILALLGLGINSIILEDVIINSVGCLVSSGGMLLVIGGFVVLSAKNMRQRVSNMDSLRQRANLLLYQVDHHLRMNSAVLALAPGPVAQPPAVTAPD